MNANRCNLELGQKVRVGNVVLERVLTSADLTTEEYLKREVALARAGCWPDDVKMQEVEVAIRQAYARDVARYASEIYFSGAPQEG